MRTVPPPTPHGPTPSARQLAWHALEFYGFVHYTVNAFTDREWGYGDESPAVFDPSALDARQWAQVARDVGMGGLILTAKHHDGFCLWPSRHTAHSVAASPWRNGKGDLVRELSDACREAGLKFGIYLSPWDRNHAAYGSPAYVDYYRRQLEEVLTGYGDLFEVWFDGANGGDGYYGGAREHRTIDRAAYYGFPDLWAMVREHQPGAVIFSDAGPDIRWVGNEIGQAAQTCWARIHPEGIHVGQVDDLRRLNGGEADGTVWRPAEVDVSTRPGWFYHPHEAPHSLRDLVDIYLCSVGRGCGLNLNITPDRCGLIPEADVQRLREFRAALDALLGDDVAAGRPVEATHVRGGAPAYAAGHVTDGDPATYWAADDAVRETSLTVSLADRARVGAIRLEEHIPLGQRIAGFAVDAWVHGWMEVAVGTTIGPRRIVTFPPVTTERIRVRITEAHACPTLGRVSVYRAR